MWYKVELVTVLKLWSMKQLEMLWQKLRGICLGLRNMTEILNNIHFPTDVGSDLINTEFLN